MAKSIFEILNTLETETSVPKLTDKDGNTTRENLGEVTHTIPAELFPDDKTFESAELLLEWAEDCGFTHALLQKGIQKGLIDTRATFKSCRQGDTWTPEYGQSNVDAMEWKITSRPGQTSTKKLDEARFKDCMAMVIQLTASSMPSDQIKAMTTGIYGEEIVTAIFNQLKPE